MTPQRPRDSLVVISLAAVLLCCANMSSHAAYFAVKLKGWASAQQLAYQYKQFIYSSILFSNISQYIANQALYITFKMMDRTSLPLTTRVEAKATIRSYINCALVMLTPSTSDIEG